MIKNKLCYIQNLQDIEAICASRGLRLEIGTDIQYFRDLCSSELEKGAIGPGFDPDEIHIPENNILWMVAYRGESELVHTQAIRLIDLEGDNLQQHLERDLADYRIGGLALDIPGSRFRLSPQARRISGKVTYHGELWLKGGVNGVRGGCLATLFSRYLMITALLKWQPDNMIGIQQAKISCRGLAAREGYLRTEQRSFEWKRRDDGSFIEGWLVWMNREEAEFNLDQPPQTFVEMLDPKPAPLPVSVTPAERNIAPVKEAA